MKKSGNSGGVMKVCVLFSLLIFLVRPFSPVIAAGDENLPPLAVSGTSFTYTIVSDGKLPASMVKTLRVVAGPLERKSDTTWQWLVLQAEKENRQALTVYMLCRAYPEQERSGSQAHISRYLLQEGSSEPVEFSHLETGRAILPATGAWPYLIPVTEAGISPFTDPESKIRYLGHRYLLRQMKQEPIPVIPQKAKLIRLYPEILTGVPHNTRQRDETRRYDESDYELIPLTKEDYQEMISAGLNCLRVNKEQVKWIEYSDIYYWGIGGSDIIYPEYLYRSNYIGPVLFLDEPMARTRDQVVKPKLHQNPSLRTSVTVSEVLEDFKTLYHKTKYEEGPTAFIKGLNAREDVDTGDMTFLQQNLYTWDTMISSACYQLSEGNSNPPYAMVFEPPGRFGTRRVLPELNMCFNCQIPPDDPKNLSDLIFSFLRGAARVTGKAWGTSIYGAVDRADTFWLLTRAYDLGASLFFYWDSYQLACVPYQEYLTMTRHLQAHARQNPGRRLEVLSHTAEIAILLPPGYNMGHVYMGRGVLWGIPELHLERKNAQGISYREVMSNFYTEVERCIRLGIAYDAFWQLEGLDLKGYREIVTIREDGKVAVKRKNQREELLAQARIPQRPAGDPPSLVIHVSAGGQPDDYVLTGQAEVREGSAPVFYTQGADREGIYKNIYVLWELFGPGEEDYYYPWTESWQVQVKETDTKAKIEINIPVKKPGRYRLRAATTDLAGRSTAVWKKVLIGKTD